MAQKIRGRKRGLDARVLRAHAVGARRRDAVRVRFRRSLPRSRTKRPNALPDLTWAAFVFGGGVRNGRAREFLFEPARFKNDPAVMRMSVVGRGAYAILFCEGWDMAEPGVLPADDVLLAILARVDDETWVEIRDEVAAAYDTVTRPGFWVQRGTVETHRAQREWFEGRVEAGRMGGIASGKQRRSTGSSTGSSTASSSASSETKRLGVVRLGEVLKVEDGESTPLAENPAVEVVEEILKPKEEWDEAFREDFWKLYPRKIKKPHASKAWQALRPKKVEDQPAMADEICSGVERWIAYWRLMNTTEDKIPYPASFLNGRQFEDFPS
jgi:uncharacterized protein YdaU (DUF1376 family)